MSTAPVFSDLQKINPSSIIELFTLTLDSALHGATTVYRFHSGTNLNANGNIIWAGNEYLKFPIQASGFAYKRGQLPRPTITISNMGTPSISAILLTVNETTAGNDLGATNPFGTPDPNAEFPQEIYYIDRKSAENREIVTWELAAVFDLAGIRAPKRQCTRALFPTIGTFNQ